jgi:hypothetical protein
MIEEYNGFVVANATAENAVVEKEAWENIDMVLDGFSFVLMKLWRICCGSCFVGWSSWWWEVCWEFS